MRMIATPVGSTVLQIATPDSDPAFPNSRAHGLVVQEEFARQVMPWAKHKRVAVDVGAHIGLWSRILARHFVNVVACEPVAENAECFKKNLDGVSNVWLAEVAVGDTQRAVGLRMPAHGNSGMWHVDSDAAPGADSVPNMVTLDSMPLEYLDFLKIDTEGYEGRVLLGGEQLIRTHKPVIVLEDNGVGPKYFGTSWIDPRPILKTWGYRRRLNWRKDDVWTA